MLLEKYEKRFEKLPDIVQFDDGGEFRNTKVLPFMKEKGIRYFSTRLRSKKAAIVERANRSLKTRMWLFFNHQDTKEWIYVLDEKFRVGDAVHMAKYASPFTTPGKKTFKKGYKASFAKEVYHITRVFLGEPNLFSIEAENGKPVMGRFYESEMSKVAGTE